MKRLRPQFIYSGLQPRVRRVPGRLAAYGAGDPDGLGSIGFSFGVIWGQPRSAFLPWGCLPDEASYLLLGCLEALRSSRLPGLDVTSAANF